MCLYSTTTNQTGICLFILFDIPTANANSFVSHLIGMELGMLPIVLWAKVHSSFTFCCDLVVSLKKCQTMSADISVGLCNLYTSKAIRPSLNRFINKAVRSCVYWTVTAKAGLMYAISHSDSIWSNINHLSWNNTIMCIYSTFQFWSLTLLFLIFLNFLNFVLFLDYLCIFLVVLSRYYCNVGDNKTRISLHLDNIWKSVYATKKHWFEFIWAVALGILSLIPVKQSQ